MQHHGSRLKYLAAPLFLAIFHFSSGVAKAAERYEVVIDRNVSVEMRDGVSLRADIYRPKIPGKFPVLLHRTAYGKTYPGVYFSVPFNAAALGYVVIVQDVRGMSDSEGDWYPFRYESQDGYDTVEWASTLPYSNGKVGMWGSSYNGAAVLLAAIASPPHLAAIFTTVTPSNYHDQFIYQGGAFSQWAGESWGLGMFQRHNDRSPDLIGGPPGTWIWKLPLSHDPLPESRKPGGLPTTLNDWLTHEAYDDYWKRWSIEENCFRITVPAFHIGGWYDIFQEGNLRNYTCLRTKGSTEAVRRGQRLIMLVGNHAGSDRIIGELDFGPQSIIDQNAIMLRWFDHVLKGISNGIENEKPVKIFVTGKNIWREEDDWPLACAKSTRYFLHSNGKANSLQGDGILSAELPQSQPADSFVYDPADPVPTRGGGTAMLTAPGPFDQRLVEVRNDVLVYTSPELKKDLEVIGPVSLELYASSSAVDTDFTGKLVDIWPNGYAQNLTDGILRAQFRNSLEKSELMNPGEVYKFVINMWATSHVFLPGHRLRLEVSSSNFPRFNRNLNSGEPLIHASRIVKATNTVYHDRGRPSALILPMVSEGR